MAVADVGSGRAVLLLHGQPGLGRDWAAVSTLLDDRYRLIAPDRPGYGGTGGAATGLFGNAAAAAGLLDELGIEEAVVVGHSLGGGIALAMAQRHPERVSALVLVASVGAPSSVDLLDRVLAWPVVGEMLAFVAFRYLGRFLKSPPALHRSNRFAPELAVLEPEKLRVRAARWQAERVWEAFSVEQRALVAELPVVVARMGDIRVPTVVVAGRRDSIVGPAASAALAHAITGAELRWVDGGHLLTVEAPEAVAAAVTAAASLPPGAGPGEGPDPPPPARGRVS